MPKGILAKTLLLLLSLYPSLAGAQVINEILYSPSTKSWIEIYNNTESTIDVSQYKILDTGAAVNGHTITAAQTGGTTMLPPHEYGVVAKDPASVSATYIFKSALGVKTTGDTVILKKGSVVVDSVQFSDNAAENGASYQKFDAGWSAVTPTPGAVNASSQSSGATSTTSGETSTATTTSTAQMSALPTVTSAHYSFVELSNDTAAKFKVSVGRERLGITKQSLVFKAVANTDDANTSYFWNFGDGSVGEGKNITHSYLLPGTYVVVLNATLFDNEAVSRTSVRVVEPELSVADANPDYIAIKNQAKSEINLYGWKIENGETHFVFAKDTIIGAGEMVKFPSAITKINQGSVAIRFIDTQARATSTRPVPSSQAVAIKDISREKEIKDITDRIAVLNKEISRMTVPKNPADTAVVQRTLKPENNVPQTAAVASALPLATSTASTTEAASSWYLTLKKFFLR